MCRVRFFGGWSILFAAMLGVIFVATECQKKNEAARGDAPKVDSSYADWKTFTYQNIKIIYPPKHPLESTLTGMAAGYTTAVKKVEEMLGMPPLTDTLKVYYYTGFGQGRAMTGRKYPYADSAAIHFWLPSFYGPTLMQYLLPRWAPDPPRHKFLKHGLISLFDFSGQNYHASTIGYKNAGKLIGLAELAVDTATNSDEERYQSGEAASFCASILGAYGPQKLCELYVSKTSFDSSVMKTLGVPLDSLQAQWLVFIKQYVPKDSIRD